MFSIRSIFTAAVALATLASAIPLTPSLPASGDVSNPASSLNQIIPANAALGSASPSLLGSLVPTKRGEAKSPGDILNGCKGDLGPIIAEIEILVKADNWDHDKCTGLINEIIHILDDVIIALKLTVSAKLTAELLLTIDGVLCTVADLGLIVYGLLDLVLGLLCLVLRLVINIDVTLAALLCSVGGLLCEILGLVLGLVVGLDIVIKGLVVDLFIGNCKYLGVTQILVILGIKL